MRQRRLHDLGREGERGGDRPGSDAAIVRAVRRAPSFIAEEAPLYSIYHVSRRPGTIARCKSPRVFVVGAEVRGIVDRVPSLDVGRTAAVLEIIDAYAAHKVVLNSSEIDPNMRELVDEERTRINELVIVDGSPIVGRGPFGPAFARKRMGRRAQTQQIENHRLAVTLPAVA